MTAAIIIRRRRLGPSCMMTRISTVVYLPLQPPPPHIQGPKICHFCTNLVGRRLGRYGRLEPWSWPASVTTEPTVCQVVTTDKCEQSAIYVHGLAGPHLHAVLTWIGQCSYQRLSDCCVIHNLYRRFGAQPTVVLPIAVVLPRTSR